MEVDRGGSRKTGVRAVLHDRILAKVVPRRRSWRNLSQTRDHGGSLPQPQDWGDIILTMGILVRGA